STRWRHSPSLFTSPTTSAPRKTTSARRIRTRRTFRSFATCLSHTHAAQGDEPCDIAQESEDSMLLSRDLEIRTRSVPTAAHLLVLGFEPLGIATHPSGTKTFRFPPEAREALERFLLAKQRLDAMLEGAELARSATSMARTQ